MKTSDSNRKVFSYIRFSTPEQALGDSERRQLEQAEQFAKSQGMTLDDTLRMADRGVSGFHGEHRKRGALRAFLDAVEAGRVLAGSTLLVENIDRLGREGVVEALSDVIFTIVKKDIVIQTLSPLDTYSRESINNGAIWRLIAHIERAHGESKRKSDLVGAAWANKRKRAEGGEILTRRVPAWLKIVDGKFVAIPEAAKTIRSIFQMKLAGMGRQAIEKKLNTSAEWMPPFNLKRKAGGWRTSYITKILNYRAVIGEYQPHRGSHKTRNRLPFGDPIPDYFPVIVKAEIFYAVQKQLAANKGKGGETGKATNLFTHLIRCAYCGGPMIFIDKGPPPKGGRYLVCDTGRRGVRDGGNAICKAHSVSYDETEAAVLENCINIRPEQVLPSPDEQTKELDRLGERLKGIVGNIADNEKRIVSLMDGLERAASREVRDRYTARIEKLEVEKSTLAKERVATETALESAEHSRKSAEQWKRELKDLRAALAAKGQVETRLRMRMHLRELIEKIETFAVGFTKKFEGAEKHAVRKASPRGGEKRPPSVARPVGKDDVEDFAGYLFDTARELDPKSVMTAEFKEFCNWVTKRRMSKHGRFLRIYFKTGLRRDIVPGDSIASGRGMEVDPDGTVGWGVKQPSVDKLEKDFRKWKRHHA